MPSPQNREEVLFGAVLGKPAAERAAFLDGACYGDPGLRQRLEALLAAQQADELPPSDAPVAKATVKLDQALAMMDHPNIAKVLDAWCHRGQTVLYY